MHYSILFGLLIALFVAGLWWLFPDTAFAPAEYAALAQLLLVSMLLISTVVYLYQKKPGNAVKHGLVWLVIAFICVVLYTNQGALQSALVPGKAQEKAAGVLVIRAAADGHFYLNAEVNGQAVRFLVDTGASSISLPLKTAERLGFKLEDLAFTTPFATANGQTFGAPITLPDITIGRHHFADVPAFVNQGELAAPLLGIRFLEKTSHIELREDELIIRF